MQGGEQVRTIGLGMFAAVALILGGASMNAPGALTIVQLAALVALAASMATRAPVRVSRGAWATLALVAAAILLGLVQTVPLPAGLWASMSGRDVAKLVFDLVSPPDIGHPLSLNPEATRRALLAMLPFVAGLLCVVRADYILRYRLVLLLVALAIAGFLLGALQFVTRGAVGLLHATPHDHAAVGFFVNRNHNADLLLIAPVLAAAVIRWDPLDRFRRIGLTLSVGLLGMFSLGVLIASSRMGIALLAVAVPIALLLAIPRLSLRRVGLVALILVGAGAALALAAKYNPVVAQVIARFDTAGEGRFVFWPEVTFAIRTFLPWGSGLGTFDAVYRSIEPLASVTPYYVNHAHNEYLEIALEAGVPGIVFIGLGLVLFSGVAVYHLRRAQRGRGDPLSLAALTGIAILLLHSLVDYPLRTPALSALFGMLWGLCFDPQPRHAVSPRPPQVSR